MINIPNKEQWEMMNEHLSNIAEALDSQIDVSTWSGVQKAVRTGIAPELFPIGSSFVVEHTTYGQLQFDVVAHDHFKNAYDSDSHTMTLMCHTSLPRIQFDRPEAFYQHTDTAEGAAGAKPIFHSDRGFQYTNKVFHQKLVDAGMIQSMSRVGRCLDNAPMEGWWGILKSEMYYLKKFTSREELVSAIEDYIHFYNTRRYQKRLNCMTPCEYYFATAA